MSSSSSLPPTSIARFEAATASAVLASTPATSWSTSPVSRAAMVLAWSGQGLCRLRFDEEGAARRRKCRARLAKIYQAVGDDAQRLGVVAPTTPSAVRNGRPRPRSARATAGEDSRRGHWRLRPEDRRSGCPRCRAARSRHNRATPLAKAAIPGHRRCIVEVSISGHKDTASRRREEASASRSGGDAARPPGRGGRPVRS